MKVFISYSHADEWLKDEFLKHLAALRRKGLIDTWHDRMIVAGARLDAEIDKNLRSADLIILLISPDFINSEYCVGIEYESAKTREVLGEATIIPVIVRDCDWDIADLKSLTALPKDAVPVTRLAHSRADAQQRDAAWLQVIEGLKPIIDAQKKRLEPASLNQDFERTIFITDARKHSAMMPFDEDKIFVEPDCYYEKENEQITTLSRIIELVLLGHATIFSGADSSGKSVIAKKLQVQLTTAGCACVRINGKSIRNADFARVTKRAKEEQLDPKEFPDKKVCLIIDDFDECTLSDRIKEDLVKFTVATFHKTVLFSFSNAPSVLFTSTSLPDPVVININAFTNDKLYRLATRWRNAGLGANSIPTETEVLTTYERLQLVFDQTEADKSPCFAVNLLHLIDTSMGSDITVSSHAACYDAMITQKLVEKGVEYKNIDEFKNFLSFVAYRAYVESEANLIAELTFSDCLVIFKEQYFSSETRLKSVAVGLFLVDRGEGFSFNEDYIWYFLCARYVVRSLQHNDKSKYIDFIEKSTQNIFQKKFANMVIYISYFSNDNFVAESLLRILDGLFSKADKWTLSDDSRDLMLGMPADQNLIIVIPEADTIGASADTFQQKIELLKERVLSVIDDVKSIVARLTLPFLNPKIEDSFFVDDMSVENASADAYLQNVNALLRIHSVLGQILNSRPGTFPASFVLDCITRMVQASGRYAFLNHAIATVLVYEQNKEEDRRDISRAFSSSSGLTQEQQFEKILRIFSFWSVYLSHAGLARYLSQDHSLRALDRLVELYEGEDSRTKQGNIPFNFTIVRTIANLYNKKEVDRRQIDQLIAKYGKHSSVMSLLRVSFHIYTYYMALPFGDKQWLSERMRMSMSRLEVQRIKANRK